MLHLFSNPMFVATRIEPLQNRASERLERKNSALPLRSRDGGILHRLVIALS